MDVSLGLLMLKSCIPSAPAGSFPDGDDCGYPDSFDLVARRQLSVNVGWKR